MRIGVQIPWFTWPEGAAGIADHLARLAERAEAAGFYSFWVMDHFFQLPLMGSIELDMLEAYTTLGFIAGRTSRIKLGAMVGGVTYRHPGILIKTVTTLDVLSQGRSYFGIGAAWFEDEHKGLGVPFPSMSERFERLEDTLKIARHMWSGDGSPIAGRHYSLENPLCNPQPLAQPHPPIMIGGSGEKKTLRMVAQYGDACNLSRALMEPDPVAAVKQKLAVLREHCDREGRPYEAIEKTAIALWSFSRTGGPTVTLTPDVSPQDRHNLGFDTAAMAIPVPNLSPAQAVEQMEALSEAGLDHIILGQFKEDLDFELVGSEIIPRVARMGRATLAVR